MARNTPYGDAAQMGASLAGFAERFSMQEVGALAYPALPEAAETRYARVVAAQLADLALRGELELGYGGEYAGPRGMVATRAAAPASAPALRVDERRLLELVFGPGAGPGDAVRLAACCADGGSWDGLADLCRQRVADRGLGWRRRERYRTLRELVRLGREMRAHAARGLPYAQAAEVHRAGYPFAVLFGIETGLLSWPAPPDEEVYLPALLPQACAMAINASMSP